MPKRKPSQPHADVHVEVELHTIHGKCKTDRATREAPQTLNLVLVEQAEDTKVFAQKRSCYSKTTKFL